MKSHIIVDQMLRKSKRVCLSPDHINEKEKQIKHGCGKVLGNCRKRVIGTWTLRFSRGTILSPVRFLLKIGAKVVRSSIRVVSLRRRTSRKVSSSATLARSRSLSDLTDSHRAKAIEDCIQFLHSSSSREAPS